MRSTVVALLALYGSAAYAQEVPRTGRITGRVVNAATGLGIPGAQVRVLGTDRGAFTGPDGRFTVAAVPVGVYGVRAGAIGFAPVVRPDVVVGTGKAYEVAFELSEIAIELAPITAEAGYFTRPPDAPASAQVLTAEDVRRAPGVQEDVLRAVSLLPGVGVTTGGRNDLIVRGGAPFENLFLVDGIEVANINHFGSQGSTGGPLSLIPIDFVADASFSAGGFGARYGDRTASVTDVRLREGARDRSAVELNLSATGFGASAEGPIGQRGSFLLGVRRSYLDLLFRAAGFSFVPQYWDVTLKTTYAAGPRDAVSFLVVGALDEVTFVNADSDDRYDNSRILAPEQDQYFAGLGWRHSLARGHVDVVLGRSWTRFATVQRDTANPPQPVFQNYSTEGENTLRTALTLHPGPGVELVVGNLARFASVLSYDVIIPGAYRLDQNGAPAPLRVDTTFTAFRNGSYAEGSVLLGSTLTLTGGLRADYYASLGDTWRLSPRVGARLAVAAATTLGASAGQYYQAPSYIWLVGDPANPAALQPFRADQVVLGIEHLLRPDLKLQFEGFAKRYADYPARVFRPQAVLAPAGFEDATTDIPYGLEPLVSEGSGRTLGLEALLQKRLSSVPVYGLVSVSVVRAEFQGLEGRDRPGSFDTRLIGNAVAGWRPNPSWEFSGRFRIATGRPVTPYITTGPDAGRLDFTRYNEGGRLPPFHALDVRVDRRWSFAGTQLEVYLDVQNVYGRRNVTAYRWDPRSQTVQGDETIGVLPSIGVNLEF